MVTYQPIPIGPEADAWWREGMLYVYDPKACEWQKDTTKHPAHAPTVFRGSCKYAILVEE